MKTSNPGIVRRSALALCLVLALSVAMVVPAFASGTNNVDVTVTIVDTGSNLDTATFAGQPITSDTAISVVEDQDYSLILTADNNGDTLKAPVVTGSGVGTAQVTGDTYTYPITVGTTNMAISVTVEELESFEIKLNLTGDADIQDDLDAMEIKIEYDAGEDWRGTALTGDETLSIANSQSTGGAHKTSGSVDVTSVSLTAGSIPTGYEMNRTVNYSANLLTVNVTIDEEGTNPTPPPTTNPGTSTGNKAEGTRVSNYNNNATYLKPSVSISEGRQTWNGSGELTFTVASESLINFNHATVDGTRLTNSQYELRAGSVILTLPESYLNTLTEGEHTLDLSFTNTQASTRFTVQKTDTGSTGSSGAGTDGTQNPSMGGGSSIPTVLFAAGLLTLAGYGLKKH